MCEYFHLNKLLFHYNSRVIKLTRRNAVAHRNETRRGGVQFLPESILVLARDEAPRWLLRGVNCMPAAWQRGST